MVKMTGVQLGGHKSLILNKTLIRHIDVADVYKSLKSLHKSMCCKCTPIGGSDLTHPPGDLAPNLLLGGAI